jgi:Rod binding domain-containing protein
VSLGTSALPPINEATLPASVRNGTPQDKKDYQAALGFERVLMGELTKAMTDTAQPAGSDGTDTGDGSDSSAQPQDAASSMYMQMLPDQLADSIVSSGGIGLAQDLYRSMKGSK